MENAHQIDGDPAGDMLLTVDLEDRTGAIADGV